MPSLTDQQTIAALQKQLAALQAGAYTAPEVPPPSRNGVHRASPAAYGPPEEIISVPWGHMLIRVLTGEDDEEALRLAVCPIQAMRAMDKIRRDFNALPEEQRAIYGYLDSFQTWLRDNATPTGHTLPLAQVDRLWEGLYLKYEESKKNWLLALTSPPATDSTPPAYPPESD